MLLLPLIAFAFVLLVLSILGLAGAGPLTDARRASRSGLPGAIGPMIGLLAGGGCLALAVIGSLAMVGLGRGDSVSVGEETHRGTSTTAPSRERPRAGPASTTTGTTSVEVSRTGRLGPEVTVEADEGTTFPASYDVADGLVPGTVLRMRVRGFEPFAEAIAEQCTPNMSGRCDNPIRVQFDSAGEAHFQYLISADIQDSRRVPDRCRATATPCAVVVRALDGTTQGAIQTIFSDVVPPPGEIDVSRSRGLPLEGETVTVRVRNYPPNVAVTVMLCAAPDATGPRCGPPGPTAPLVVGRNGRGSAKLAVTPGRVGRELASCSRGDDCGISVASDDVFARAPVVPIAFAAPPGAAYDPTRLVVGLGFAVLLVAIAAWLLWRTDWAAVGEAAAPEIDAAKYADLDAIIAALPPEEEEVLSSR